LNWRKIADSWNSFTSTFELDDESESRHYGYGKREIYKASEVSDDLEIHYSFKLTKSVNGGLANHAGNRTKCTVRFDNARNLELTVRQKPFLKRLFSRSDRIEIHSNLENIKYEFSRKRFTELLSSFPDLSVTTEGDRLKLFSKYHFRSLEDLQNLRFLLIDTGALINKLSS
jgi:hypothetical protein